MLILNETVGAGDDIAGRIDRLRHALSLWSRIMVVNKGPAAGAFFCASGSSNMKWTIHPFYYAARRPGWRCQAASMNTFIRGAWIAASLSR
ncbi:hypothetical protein NKJ35_21560 [Mesorhizobium sp. M0136]|uniref:hypothetical protein n=1 Tax=Mesorhizobium sp. M0136 TaxID=2956890 RepID=UPI00333D32FF